MCRCWWTWTFDETPATSECRRPSPFRQRHRLSRQIALRTAIGRTDGNLHLIRLRLAEEGGERHLGGIAADADPDQPVEGRLAGRVEQVPVSAQESLERRMEVWRVEPEGVSTDVTGRNIH